MGDTSDSVSEAPPVSARSASRRSQSHAESVLRRAKVDRSVRDAADALPASAPLPPSRAATSDEASADRFSPGYIGVYTTGPDGMRRFRSLP